MRHYISLLLLAAIFFSSCSSSDDVVSRGAISKRKYRDGFHLDLRKHNHKDIAKTYTSDENSAPQVGQVEKEDSSELVTSANPSENPKYEVVQDNRVFRKLRPKKMVSNDRFSLKDTSKSQTKTESKKDRKKSDQPRGESEKRLSQDEILAIVFTCLAFFCLFTYFTLGLFISLPIIVLVSTSLAMIIGIVSSILGLVFSIKSYKANPTSISLIFKVIAIALTISYALCILLVIIAGAFLIFLWLFL